MKVLIIGGSGIISADVARQAVEMGMDVILLNRGNKLAFCPKAAHIIQTDIRNLTETTVKVNTLNVDVIIDFISYTPEHLRNNLHLFRGRYKQYIFISSVAVYQTTGLPGITEDNTLTTNLAWDYARNKIACEQTLIMENRLYGICYTIVRPGETYSNLRIPGVLVPQPHHYSIIDRMMKGKKIVVHDDGRALCTFTHASDFSRGLIGLIMNANAYGEAFHITSDEAFSWREVTEKVAEAAGLQVDIAYLPSLEIVKRLPKTTYGDTYGVLLCAKAFNKVFNNSKIKAAVPGFQCSVPFAEGIRRTIHFYDNNPQYKSIDENWGREMDQLVDVAQIS